MWQYTMTNNPVHFTSNTIGYYIAHAETAIAANTPVWHSALQDIACKSGKKITSFALI